MGAVPFLGTTAEAVRWCFAECIKKVRTAFLLQQFGPPEAVWKLEVEKFPVVVTMEAHGRSLRQEILTASHL